MLVCIYCWMNFVDVCKIYEDSELDLHIKACKPQENVDVEESLNQLKELNEDVVGWLVIDGTKIDYPFVQGVDDLEYINKNINQEYTLSGSLYLSCMNHNDMSDQINVIYGHRMNNHAMFGDLVKYLDQDFMDSHLKGKVYFNKEERELEAFMCCKVRASDPYIYEMRLCNSMKQEELFLEHINKLAVSKNEGSTFDFKKDRFVILSTCSKYESDERIIVLFKM